jgi:hypothetical protein
MKAPRRSRPRRILLGVILAGLLAVPADSLGFYPSFHIGDTVEPLEGDQFSYGQTWMLAYFDIEVDLATEVPMFVCRSIIKWPTKNSVCSNCFPDTKAKDWCAGACMEDWANHCLPFHSPGNRPAKGLQKVTQEWNLESMTSPLHSGPGERCYDWLVRYGHMLHAVQDFYAHSKWVEVFHLDLGFDFDEIPTWTSFQKAQRGGRRNLILLKHAGGDAEQAGVLYDRLDERMKIENHSLWNKDSDHLADSTYDDANKAAHRDSHGHNVADFHEAAFQLAGTETYQLGLQTRLNIENNPRQGAAAWSRLFDCVSEMAAGDGISYEDELLNFKHGIWRFHTYASLWFKWR